MPTPATPCFEQLLREHDVLIFTFAFLLSLARSGCDVLFTFSFSF